FPSLESKCRSKIDRAASRRYFPCNSRSDFMNEQQKTTLLIGALVFLAMGLYPPWMTENAERPSLMAPPVAVTHHSGRYDWIFDPPPSSYIDMSRLSVQWLVVVVVGCALGLALMKDNKRGESPNAEAPEASKVSELPEWRGAGTSTG